jgi:hypothetical protein
VEVCSPLGLLNIIDPSLLASAPPFEQLVSDLLVTHQLLDLLRELLLAGFEVVQHLLLPQLLPTHLIGLLIHLLPLPQDAETATYAGIAHQVLLVAIDIELAVYLDCLRSQDLYCPL